MSTAMALDRPKLAKILAMMGSAHDGEVAAAARMAERMVKAAGLTWDAVLNGAADGERRQERPRPEDASVAGNQELARRVLASGYSLTDWEDRFIRDMVHRRWFSAKQLYWLHAIAAKAGVAAD